MHSFELSVVRFPMMEAEGLHRDVEVGFLPGTLTVPEENCGVVLFAHGSGSSLLSPRNRYVARRLNESNLGTLLFDLLTPDEEIDRSNVFDVDLLAERLLVATEWTRTELGVVPLGYFGASTGAAAALRAAATENGDVRAVVSRGGRPDLAADHLEDVRAPTLLIVGGRDRLVLDLNRSAQRRLRCESRLEIIAGATHLFEEPGALDRVAELAVDWFEKHLGARGDQGSATKSIT